MTKLWLMTPTAVVGASLSGLRETRPPGIEVVNGAELDRLIDPMMGSAASAGPIPRLPSDIVLHLAAVSTVVFDYLDIGYRLVSGRLRAAMALAEEDAQFLGVDTGRCPPAVRAMDYRWLRPTHRADPFDRDRSDGEYQDVYTGSMADWTPMAATVRTWRVRLPEPGRAPRIRWRDAFVAPSPLFEAAGLPWTLVDDELAARIRGAGIEDVSLQDVTTGAA